MARKKKLIIGDIVQAYFLSSPERCTVVKVIDKNSYKLRMKCGTFLPGVKWKKDMDKKSPWYIDAYLGHHEVVKSNEDQNTSPDTTDLSKLKKAINIQKNFVKGKIDK
tara:strand:- start:296 stop:619 length:324 start_codon:yes stop_codon:yes gene_type:complete